MCTISPDGVNNDQTKTQNTAKSLQEALLAGQYLESAAKVVSDKGIGSPDASESHKTRKDGPRQQWTRFCQGKARSEDQQNRVRESSHGHPFDHGGVTGLDTWGRKCQKTLKLDFYFGSVIMLDN